ncbi:transmembrane protein [Cystoisospora suis]|uniref:Transmembrane protein n=1 Tax=Cystoisospora suis TaxID=483139 RepID=A0A2C6KT94_9APIC|nr:transmembrane protein [Cystoisospora suis]
MEKYRVFGDESTGVHPFIPLSCMKAQLTPQASSLLVRLLTSTLSLILSALLFLLAILRLLLLSFAALWTAVVQQVLIVFAPFSRLYWYLSLWLLAFPKRLALYSLGVFRLEEQRADFRRLKIRAPPPNSPSPCASLLSLPVSPFSSLSGSATGGLSAADAKRIASCRVCFSNFTSFVEPLYLSYRLNPQFVLIHEKGGFSFCSFWEILRFSLQFRLAPGRGTYRSLSSLLVAHATRSSPAIPVVIFPEGQKSNGLCILQWWAGEEKSSAVGFDAAALRLLEGRIAEVGCMYSSIFVKGSERQKTSLGRRVPYGPAHTINSPLTHLRCLLSEVCSNGLVAIWASPTDVQQASSQARGAGGGDGRAEDSETAVACLRDVMVRMMPGIASVNNKSGRDLAPFVDYWEKTQKEQYLKKDKKF